MPLVGTGGAGTIDQALTPRLGLNMEWNITLYYACDILYAGSMIMPKFLIVSGGAYFGAG